MRRVPILTIAAALAMTLHVAAQPSVPVARVTGSAGASAHDVRVLPGARGATVIIQGNALTSTNGTLADAAVRLRDARFGGIVDTTITDKSGLFTFNSVEPGSYVVELVGPDQSVLAASPILNVNAGESATAIVKLPFRVPPAAISHTARSAIIVTSAAAATGVLATEVAGAPASARR